MTSPAPHSLPAPWQRCGPSCGVWGEPRKEAVTLREREVTRAQQPRRIHGGRKARALCLASHSQGELTVVGFKLKDIIEIPRKLWGP